ncbi:hypothetical protein P4O66_009724 [Electrophorus voltai]|uniref:Uncharacterized protein n=1 Tax=Electrophorus voltai TaxID=2609070 RepID=A0AAD8ZFN9_9TELE|nr:hypothetical protein P4O66_009724 [Electrophorus voltai]
MSNTDHDDRGRERGEDQSAGERMRLHMLECRLEKNGMDWRRDVQREKQLQGSRFIPGSHLEFFSIVLVVFISELTTAMIVLSCSPLFENILKTWAMPAVQQQYGKDSVVTDMWNITMTKLQCWGFINNTDFSDYYYSKTRGGAFKSSCYNHTESIYDLEDALNSAMEVSEHNAK